VTEPLPQPLWDAIKLFLRDGKTGQILLNVNSGQVESFDIHEHRRIVRRIPVACQRTTVLDSEPTA
jgi:hypothetical protein